MPISSVNTSNPASTTIIDAVIEDGQQQIMSALQGIYNEENRASSSRTSTEIQYIPVLFTILYNGDQSGQVLDAETIDDVYAKALFLIDNANSVFEGTNSNSSFSLDTDGNWQSILSNAAHQITSKVRFFLPYKIPKEHLYPFFPTNIVGPHKDSVDFSSLENFKNSFGFGLPNIPPTEGISYTSEYTYEDVRDQRILVKELYAESLLNNNNETRDFSLLEEAKQTLVEMEDDYFFFFGNKPGIIFIRRFNDDMGFTLQTDALGNNVIPFQMNAIRNLENGEAAPYHTSSDNTGGSKLYDPLVTHTHPSSGLFCNLPFVKVQSTTEVGSYNNGFLGQTGLANTLKSNINTTAGMNLHSLIMFKFINTDHTIADYKSQGYSVFIHEFFHMLGYGHSRNGFSMSGKISFEGKATAPYSRSESSSRSNAANFDKFYMPFEPPFTYYDPYNSEHDLENPSTLPDLSIIDPNEQKYVETVINEVLPTATDNFTRKAGFTYEASSGTGGTRFIFTDSGISVAGNANESNKRSLAYSELFGMVSHLPTFWGGSYTENEDGTKSFLINASYTTEEENIRGRVGRSLLAVGDDYGGGVVAHISETKIYIVQKVRAFNQANQDLFDGNQGQMAPSSASYSGVDAPADIDAGLTNTQYLSVHPTTNETLTGYAPYNILNYTLEGYSDWYIPSLDLALAMHDNFTDIDLPGSAVEWLQPNGTPTITGTSFWSTNSGYNAIDQSERLITSSRVDENGVLNDHRKPTYLILEDGTVGDNNFQWAGTKHYVLFRDVDIADVGLEIGEVEEEVEEIEEIEEVEEVIEEVIEEVNLNRIGPNITVYNPVCLEDENGERTLVNWALPWSLDWYNPAFPAFPNNTRVEDMFSPELCPCLYADQTLNIGAYNETITSYTFKLFEALIDNVTGNSITTTTGIPVVSEGSRAITQLLRDEVCPTGCGTTNGGQGVLPASFGTSRARGNVAVNTMEYFGYESQSTNSTTGVVTTTITDIVWLKRSGDMIVPNFPVYIGFMPESPLPGFFRFDSSKFSSTELGIGQFEIYLDHNDPSIFSIWGQQFYPIIDKYLRTGSTNEADPDYNPFLQEVAGLESELGANDINFANWKNYQDRTHNHAFGASTWTGDHPLEKFFQRRLPNTTNPALDNMPDTMYGPINQNLTSSVMYYETSLTQPILPTPSMMQRLNFLAENHADSPTVGFWAVCKKFTNDLYDVSNAYQNALPDYNQQIRSKDQINAYVSTAIDHIETQAFDITDIVEGCMNENAFNYNPNATFPDGSCIDRVYGCIDPEAVIYNAAANTDDGSCEYYSLVPEPIMQIPVCPAEFVWACNNNTSGYTPIDINNQISNNPAVPTDIVTALGLNYITGSGDNPISSMLTYLTSVHWNDPTNVAALNEIRFGLGINGCTQELGTVTEGALNLGGGCVNVLDFSACTYPTVSNYQCDLLGEVTSVSDIGNITSPTIGSVTFSEAGTIGFTELAAYFSEVSSLGYTIGQC